MAARLSESPVRALSEVGTLSRRWGLHLHALRDRIALLTQDPDAKVVKVATRILNDLDTRRERE